MLYLVNPLRWWLLLPQLLESIAASRSCQVVSKLWMAVETEVMPFTLKNWERVLVISKFLLGSFFPCLE